MTSGLYSIHVFTLKSLKMTHVYFIVYFAIQRRLIDTHPVSFFTLVDTKWYATGKHAVLYVHGKNSEQVAAKFASTMQKVTKCPNSSCLMADLDFCGESLCRKLYNHSCLCMALITLWSYPTVLYVMPATIETNKILGLFCFFLSFFFPLP